jgi:hypothetical protein
LHSSSLISAIVLTVLPQTSNDAHAADAASSSGTQVSSIQGNVVSVNPNAYATSTASCGSGMLVGGGYTTTQGSTSVMRIYTNGRSSNTGSTWQASAFSTTGSAKWITAFAYCLMNTSFTFSQTAGSMDQAGVGFASCSPNTVMGGGFSFPPTSDYKVNHMYGFGSMTYIVNMQSVPSTGDPNAKAYAECLAYP